MRVSYLELYNEELCDLLSTDDTSKIRIFDDAAKVGITFPQGLDSRTFKRLNGFHFSFANAVDQRVNHGQRSINLWRRTLINLILDML